MVPPLIHWLHQFPSLVIWMAIAITNLLLFLIIPLAVRRALNVTLNAEVARGADDAFKNIITLTMALIAFSLVQVEGLHRNVADLVSREGAILLKFDRTFDDLPDAQADLVEKPLRTYVASLIESEWPAMAKGERSEEASANLNALAQGIKALGAIEEVNPSLVGDLRGQFVQVKDIREARLATSHMNLSPYFWWGILAAMVCLMTLGWFQTPVEKAIPYVAGITLGLSTLLAMLIVSSGIFEGASRVQPDAIARTLALIDSPEGPVTPQAAKTTEP